MEPRKHLYIDGLRGAAILLVLLVHNLYLGAERTWFPATLKDILDGGQFGVQLFFMVSAFTLMSSFHSRAGEPFPTQRFFVRRFFRIAPMYYLAIAYFAFQSFLGFDYFLTGKTLAHLSVAKLFSYVFFLNGFNPYWINNLVPGGWSVAVEVTFYLALPLLFRKVKNVDGALMLLAGSVVFRVVLELLLHKTFANTNEYLYYYFPNQLPVFSLGVLAYFVSKDGASLHTLRTLVLAAATVLLLSVADVGMHFTVSLGFFVLLVVLARKPLGFVANNALAQIGRVSFSLYLVHFAVMHWFEVFGWKNFVAVTGSGTAALNYLLRFFLLLVTSFLVSSVCYRFIELPFQRLGKRFVLRFCQPQMAALPVADDRSRGVA